MQFMVPRYLEQAMSSFTMNQEQMRKSLQDTFGGLFPFGSLEEMGKQNLALVRKDHEDVLALPRRHHARHAGAPGIVRAAVPAPARTAAEDNTIKDLTTRLDQLQKKLEEMNKGEKQD